MVKSEPTTSTSIMQVIKPIIDASELTEYLDLSFDAEISIRVKANSRELIEVLRNYFGEFVSSVPAAMINVEVIDTASVALELDWIARQPDPGKKRIKEEYLDFRDGRLVRKRLTSVLFAMTDKHNLAVGPCLQNSNQIINFINNRYIEWQLRQGGLVWRSRDFPEWANQLWHCS